MKNFPKDIVIIWFDGAMMSKDDFVEVAAVKIADGIVSEYCQYFVNVDIDGKPIDADRLSPELGGVGRQHLLVGTSAANALDALAKFMGRSVPFVWNVESQRLYQRYADRLGGAAKALGATRMLQAIRLKMLFDSDDKHLKSASSVYRALERTEEHWGRMPEISDGRSDCLSLALAAAMSLCDAMRAAEIFYEDDVDVPCDWEVAGRDGSDDES